MRRAKSKAVRLLLRLAGLAAPAVMMAAGPCSGNVGEGSQFSSFTEIVSLTSTGAFSSGSINAWNTRIAMSEDGRYVAFSTSASLVPDDTSSSEDVYVRDMTAGVVMLASRATGAAGAVGNGASSAPTISANGQFVAFQSAASNLGTDADTTLDIFVRDIVNNTTTLVSLNFVGALLLQSPFTPGTRTDARGAFISADGNHVAFHTQANNVIDTTPTDSNGYNDVYMRVNWNGALLIPTTTELISRATGAGGAIGTRESGQPAVSGDGSKVAFLSVSDNLEDASDPAIPAGTFRTHVYVRDRTALTTKLLDVADWSMAPPAVSDTPDGWVNTWSPAPVWISSDGNYVVYVSNGSNLHPDDTDNSYDVFMRHTSLGNSTYLVDRASGASGPKANGSSDNGGANLVVSRDGRFVSFVNSGSNLVPGDTNGQSDVFVRDTQAHNTIRVSVNTFGEENFWESDGAGISGDGRFATFITSGTNMVAGKVNFNSDGYRRGPLY